MNKLILCILFCNANFCYAAAGDGTSGEMQNIISITPINETQDSVCYQTEDNNITCVIVERD